MKISILLLVMMPLLIGACNTQNLKNRGAIYPQPVVAFGFVVYGGVRNDQMYFAPLKDSSKQKISQQDFKSESLAAGFSFSPSKRIQEELSLIDTFTINNQMHDKRLIKHMGTTTYSPVRIVYEIDPDAPGVFSKDTGIDTIILGRNRYEKSGEKVSFIVRFPGADVLKIGQINK